MIGASVAYHLAARGCRDVVVLERAAASGEGSTGRATGGFRAQFSTEIGVRLSLLAREKLRRFRDELGVDPGYRPCGYLFMARTEAELRALREALAVQRRAGLGEAAEVAVAEIGRLSPAVRTDDLAGGAWCPTDGFIVPREIMRGYLEGARRLGVRVEYGTGDVAVTVEGSRGTRTPGGDARRVTGVRTPRETIATARVVNAAGPWAGVVARTAGVDLPVSPLRRQTAVTHPFPALPEDTPMTIDVADGFHFRVRDGRVLMLWPEDTRGADPTDPFDTAFDPRWLEGLLPRAHARVPCLRDARIDPALSLCGLYEMSPDKHVILGEARGAGGFYLANGASGHGVMHSPILGQLLAEIVLDGQARTLDVRALRPSRFADGEPNHDTGVL